MKASTKSPKRQFAAVAVGTVLIGPGYAMAKSGVFESLVGQAPSHMLDLDSNSVEVGGWMAAGINYNASNPSDRSNGPVSMIDREGEFHLYQLDLFVEKSANKAGYWDWGGRFDFMYGTDSRYVQATGHWDSGLISGRDSRFYDIALPQAYLEVYAPYGNGLTAKLGHFYGIVGYESVSSPMNFFASHSYSFKSSPFTVTGVLLDYILTKEWTLNLGAVKGADNFDRDPGAWSHMSGLSWNHEDTGTALSFSVMQGDVYQNRSSELIYYSAIFQQTMGDFHYVLQHDRGTQDNAVDGNRRAEWYSLVSYLDYVLNEDWRVGVRGEWFRDHDGVRYGNGSANYYAATGGLNWQAAEWLTVRPEVRYDWAQTAGPAFDDGLRNDQFLFAVDAVIRF